MIRLGSKKPLSILIVVLMFVLIILWLSTPSSRHTIAKTVVNANDEPIEDIVVELWKNGAKIDQKTTDNNGKAEFKNLPVGTYTIKLPSFNKEETVFLNEDKEIKNKIVEKEG